MADVIAVRPQDTLDTLLAEIASRPDRSLVLWVPRGTKLLRQMEDYQALKDALRRNHAQLKILSADARIVGLAMVFGVEAEISPTPPAGAPADAVVSVAPDHPAPAGDRAGAPSPVPPAPITAPLGRPPAPPTVSATIAVPLDSGPLPPAGVSESDWLLDDEANLAAILDADDLTRSRSAQPPPDVLAGLASTGFVPTGAASPPPPAAPRGAESAAVPANARTDAAPPPTPHRTLDPAASAAAPAAPRPGAATSSSRGQPAPIPVNPATQPLPPLPGPDRPSSPETNGPRGSRRRNEGIPFTLDPAPAPVVSAPPVPPAAPPAPGPVWASAEDDDGPAMTFAEWIAREAAHAGAAAPGATLLPDVDLERLPAWLRESLARAEPLPPPLPAPPPAAPTSRKPFQPGAGAINPLTGRPATGPLFPPDEERVPPAPVPRSSAVLRCPHCGEELDKEQMLRMLAEVWGL